MAGTTLKDIVVGVIGLGYVGLPLAITFSKHFSVIGFDVDEDRIKHLCGALDHTGEVESEALLETTAQFTSSPADLNKVNFFIVTVPTPVDKFNIPNLDPLRIATLTVGAALKFGDFVVYESTVYPGATEEICVPLLEKSSGLCFNKDFFVGYSPERINPGDKSKNLTDIVKVTSGSTPQAANFIDEVYGEIITAGTKKASNIRIAEAAKVIENVQRDVNIALVNEFALLFNRMGISTSEVLEVASTKWNFLHFTPGLVGGHCIGVDPYYLTYKSQEVGFHPALVCAGRRINDCMAAWYADFIAGNLRNLRMYERDLRGLVLGLTFKENCPDVRNSKSPEVCEKLADFGYLIDVFDPHVHDQFINFRTDRITLLDNLEDRSYDFVVVLVSHSAFVNDDRLTRIYQETNVIFDLKSAIPETYQPIRL